MTVRESIRLSLIRTITPIVAGWIGLQLLRFGWAIDDATTGATVAAVLSMAYYAVVRELEVRWPSVGRLLGAAKPPLYDTIDGELQRHLDRVAAIIREQNVAKRDATLKAGTSYPDTPPSSTPTPAADTPSTP